MWLSEKPEVQVLPSLPKIRGRGPRRDGKSGVAAIVTPLPKFRSAVSAQGGVRRGRMAAVPGTSSCAPAPADGCRRHGLSDSPLERSKGVLAERVAPASRRFQVLEFERGGRRVRVALKAGRPGKLPPSRLAVVGAAEVLFTEGMDAITAVYPAPP